MRRLGDLLRTATIAGTLCLASVPASRAQPSEMPGWVTAWPTSMQDPLPTGFPVGNRRSISAMAQHVPWQPRIRPELPDDCETPGGRRADQAQILEPDGQQAGHARSHERRREGGGQGRRGRHGEGRYVRRRRTGHNPGGPGDPAAIPSSLRSSQRRTWPSPFTLSGSSGPITWHAKAMVTNPVYDGPRGGR